MKLALTAITISERRRADMGDLDGLAASISRYGLLHPPVVDDSGNLVAGERRIRAVERLGWAEIETRSLGELTEAERQEIELEENLQRKDLTAYERSKTLVRLAETAQEIAKVEAETCAESTQVSPPARGPSRTLGSLRDVASRIGVPEPTIRAAEAHVAAVEKYPELDQLPQAPAIAVAKTLDTIPDPKRDAARDAIREQAQAEQAKSTELLQMAGVFEDPEIQQKRLCTAYSKAIAQVHHHLLMLDPLAVAAALPPSEISESQRFMRQTREWLDTLETALSHGLRVVAGKES